MSHRKSIKPGRLLSELISQEKEPEVPAWLSEQAVEPDPQGDEAWMDAVAEHSSMQIRAYERSSK